MRVRAREHAYAMVASFEVIRAVFAAGFAQWPGRADVAPKTLVNSAPKYAQGRFPLLIINHNRSENARVPDRKDNNF